ncbi:unnamed protein product [Caretta caretta]
MLRKFMEEDPQHWDKLLPVLLFAMQVVPQTSSGFSPFKLLYARQPRGILDLLREMWEEQESRIRGSVQYILRLQEHLLERGTMAWENLLRAQHAQENQYNRGKKMRVFEPRDRVLLLLPYSEGHQRDAQIYHMNLFKAWKKHEGLMIASYPPEPELGPLANEPVEPGPVAIGQELDPNQQEQVWQLVSAFPTILSA